MLTNETRREELKSAHKEVRDVVQYSGFLSVLNFSNTFCSVSFISFSRQAVLLFESAGVDWDEQVLLVTAADRKYTIFVDEDGWRGREIDNDESEELGPCETFLGLAQLCNPQAIEKFQNALLSKLQVE